jgi:hypothetical protein
LFGAAVPARAQTAALSSQQLMQEAYDFAYPLYKLSEYRWTALNTRDARTSTTLNHFAHSRASATPEDKWADAPIVDALYSTAWLDLSRGPVWLDTPETHGRYYVLTLIDFYSNTFFYAGHRTTGTHAQRYFVAGPDWHGAVPAGTQLLRAPTNDVYVNLRVLIDGPKDQAAANAVQDGFRFTPVQGAPADAAATRVQPVPKDGRSFVDVVNQMLAMNPPPERDAAILAKYRAIGICGAPCSWEALPDSVKAQWTATYPSLEGKFLAAYRSAGRASGWIEYNPPGSKLGSTQMLDYSLRAMALSVGKGMLGVTPAEADYWMTFNDAKGQPLTGGRNYRLHFATGGLPANAFWSVALYAFEKDGQFLAANPIDRYHVGSRTGLKANADGSIDIWIQSTPPSGDKRSNWLPAPADGARFQLFARAYEPKAEILEGRFKMPEVEALP